jgi:hypothetical protein
LRQEEKDTKEKFLLEKSLLKIHYAAIPGAITFGRRRKGF